jgi:hypothetical protein
MLLRSTVRLIWRYKAANSNAKWRMPEVLKVKVADDVAVVPCNLPDAPERRMLFSPCWSLLTRQRRTQLDADPEVFFIKVHNRPPCEPTHGEMAVQNAGFAPTFRRHARLPCESHP